MEKITINSVEFRGSFPREESAPQDGLPEFAFIGRSNVGKSSLINMLCNRKEIAKVSNKPGKTQLLNYFLVNNHWYLVDLPGYGYAKVSKDTRKSWGKMIEYYFKNRKPLQCAMVLIDSNIPPQKIDIEFINWLGANQVPFSIVYTKIDRLSRNQAQHNVTEIQKALLAHWNELPPQFITSASKATGREELLSFIDNVNREYGQK